MHVIVATRVKHKHCGADKGGRRGAVTLIIEPRGTMVDAQAEQLEENRSQ